MNEKLREKGIYFVNSDLNWCNILLRVENTDQNPKENPKTSLQTKLSEIQMVDVFDHEILKSPNTDEEN